MANPYSEYYTNQAGNGIPGYGGIRYQRGKGLFSKVLPGVVMPLLKYLGKTALSTGYDIAKDTAHGSDFKKALKHRLAETGINIAEEGIKKAREYTQRGLGRRKRKRTRCIKRIKHKTKLIKKTSSKGKRRKINKKGVKKLSLF